MDTLRYDLLFAKQNNFVIRFQTKLFNQPCAAQTIDVLNAINDLILSEPFHRIRQLFALLLLSPAFGWINRLCTLIISHFESRRTR